MRHEGADAVGDHAEILSQARARPGYPVPRYQPFNTLLILVLRVGGLGLFARSVKAYGGADAALLIGDTQLFWMPSALTQACGAGLPLSAGWG